MSMNLKIFDLRCFITLSAHKNFTKAAQEMHISQPPFSRIIQKIEFEMGAVLINRSPSFSLTPLGKSFLKEAQQMVNSYEKSIYRMEALRSPKSQELKVGFTPLVSQMPGFYELINDLSNLTPQIYLNELSSQNLCKMLQDYTLDIGITHFTPNLKSLQSHQIKPCKAAVLLPQQVCCFREKTSYYVILNENKMERPYNQHLLKNLTSYHLIPLYKGPSQLSPQMALQGRGILIYPEPNAKIINVNNTFALEEINDSIGLFGICMVTQKKPFKRLTELIIKNYA